MLYASTVLANKGIPMNKINENVCFYGAYIVSFNFRLYLGT